MFSRIQRLVTEIQHSMLWASVMVLMALLAILLLFLEWFLPLSADLIVWFHRVDLAIAYIFLTDFFGGLFFNVAYRSKWSYFKDNWLNLLSSIPMTSEVTSVLRALRILRAIRIIRAIRAGMNFTFAELRVSHIKRGE